MSRVIVGIDLRDEDRPGLRVACVDCGADVAVLLDPADVDDVARAAAAHLCEPGTWYAVVTFGAPSVRVPRAHRDLAAAKRAAAACKGTGTCGNASVVVASSRADAEAADISERRHVVWTAP